MSHAPTPSQDSDSPTRRMGRRTSAVPVVPAPVVPAPVVPAPAARSDGADTPATPDAAGLSDISASSDNPDNPDHADDYRIEILEDFLEEDPEVNAILRQAGFSQEQAQLVYDLAAEKLLPMVEELGREAAHSAAQARLESHFGGAERWREIRRQLQHWGARSLPPQALEALSDSVEGVLALHRLMQSESTEPGPITRPGGGGGGEPVNEPALRKLMRDPRYWRDRDPAFIGRIAEGYRRLYPGGNA